MIISRNLCIFFLLLIINHTLCDQYEVDPNGYIAFCPCMGIDKLKLLIYFIYS